MNAIAELKVELKCTWKELTEVIGRYGGVNRTQFAIAMHSTKEYANESYAEAVRKVRSRMASCGVMVGNERRWR